MAPIHTELSPDAKFATQVNASISRNPNVRLLILPEDNKKIYPSADDKFTTPQLGFKLEKFKVKTVDEGGEMGWDHGQAE